MGVAPAFRPDGIPDRVSAVNGDRRYWTPGIGKRLDVSCDGVRLRYVIEADRAAGWVLTRRYLESVGDVTLLDGTRMVRGMVTFRVVVANAPTRYLVRG